MAPYELSVPEVGRTPVVVEVPHAGLKIPDALQGELLVGLWARLRRFWSFGIKDGRSFGV